MNFHFCLRVFVDVIRVLACLSAAVFRTNNHILSFKTPSIYLAHSRPWPFRDDDIHYRTSGFYASSSFLIVSEPSDLAKRKQSGASQL